MECENCGHVGHEAEMIATPDDGRWLCGSCWAAELEGHNYDLDDHDELL